MGTRRDVELVIDGLRYAEGPRWHDGRLWLSDMLGGQVMSWNESDGLRLELTVGEPSGLGFLAGGRVLVVDRHTTSLLAGLPGEEPRTYASLPGVIGVNDMVVAADGTSYVGSLGKRYELGDEHRAWGDDAPGVVLRVRPDGSHDVAAAGLACPNAMVITPDGGTLVVAETYRSQLVAFRLAADGSLHDRRVVARLEDRMVDGLALDAAGSFWVGCGERFAYVDQHGVVIDEIVIPGEQCIACALGGADRRTLYLVVCRMTMDGFVRGESSSSVYACRVDEPGVGRP